MEKIMRLHIVLLLFGLGCLANVESAVARNYFVAKNGNDQNAGTKLTPFATIQHALNVADQPGDKVLVRSGRYFEKIVFPHSGNSDGYIWLRPFKHEAVVLDGKGVSGRNMVLMEDVNYVRISDFEIVNFRGNDGSGVRFVGAGHHIQILDNVIHEMRGKNAMGVTVYGTSAKAVSRIVIRGNQVFDCDPAPSEAIVVNGNVSQFTIEANTVHDVNNIGIDAIGGERDINQNQKLVARNGVIRGNLVYNARSSYGGGFAAGIYIDGGKSIVVEQNEIFGCDLGLEVGAENPGLVTNRIRVRNNLIYLNDKVGIVFGGYARSRGRVENCRFYNNTVYKNDTLNEGVGQLWIQYASKNIIVNNIFWAGDNNVLTYSELGNTKNRLDFNLWFADAAADQVEIVWQRKFYPSLAEFSLMTRQEIHGVFDNPRFRSGATNFMLQNNSPAIDAGVEKPGWFAENDFRGAKRPRGKTVDLGAYEK
jgi:hypothetical protein